MGIDISYNVSYGKIFLNSIWGQQDSFFNQLEHVTEAEVFQVYEPKMILLNMVVDCQLTFHEYLTPDVHVHSTLL